MIPDSVILIVGASSGIGRACAKLLAARGAVVVGFARRFDRLQQLQAEVAGAGGKLSIQACDVSQPVQIHSAVADAVRTHGRIDALVYAAGTNIPERGLPVLSPENWHKLIDTNLTGAFHCTQAVLPTLRAQQSGLIIYISTGAVQRPDVSGVAYQASKHGLTGLAGGTRQEEKQHGIRTTLIFPGLCDTEILNQRPVPTPPETLAKSLRPEDVAAAVAFVCDLDPRCHVPELQIFPAQL